MSLFYDDTSSTISYNPGFQNFTSVVGLDNGTMHQNPTYAGEAYADISFTGSEISVWGSSRNNHGRIYCYLSDMPHSPWAWFNTSLSTEAVTYNLILCSSSGIPNTAHVLRIGKAETELSFLNVRSRNTLRRQDSLTTVSFDGGSPGTHSI